MAVAPPSTVLAAGRQPLVGGLFSTFTFRPDDSTRWENGLLVDALTCEPADGIGDPACDPDETTGLPKNLVNGEPPFGEATPFIIYGHATCAPIGRWDDAEGRAREHLLVREESRVEQAFWTGDLGNKPSLRGATVITTTPTGPDIKDRVDGAIAALEGWLAANYGSLGVIHMTRTLATLSHVEAKGNRVTTRLGTPIAAGAGYDGSGPTGQAASATSQWLYVTPAMFGYRGDVFLPSNRRGDLFDRSHNLLYAVAERSYLLGFDPCGHAAVQINLA